MIYTFVDHHPKGFISIFSVGNSRVHMQYTPPSMVCGMVQELNHKKNQASFLTLEGNQKVTHAGAFLWGV